MGPVRRLPIVLLLVGACERVATPPAAEIGERPAPITTVVAEAPWGLPPRFARPPGPCTGEMHSQFEYDRDPRFVAERTRFGGDPSVGRNAEALRVRTRTGVTLLFQDCRADDGEMNVRYVYHGRGPRARGHLIERGFYEGGDWLWINDSTGEATSLVQAPLFAADSLHLAVANADLYVGSSPNVLEVWEVDGSSIVLRVRALLGERTGARNPRWTGVREVLAERIELNASGDEVVRGTLRASDSRGRWTVDSVAP